MKIPRKVISLLVFFLHSFHCLSAQNPENLVSVSLESDSTAIKPGDTAWLMINLKIKPNWHIYWKTSGQSGYPTTVEWNTEGVEFSDLHFPSPQFYEVMEMASYVHEGSITLLSEITLDEKWEGERIIEISGRLSTLICNESNCLPFTSDLSLQIAVSGSTELSTSGIERVNQAKDEWPRPTPLEAQLSLLAKKNTFTFEIQHPRLRDLNPDDFYFFPQGNYFAHGSLQKFYLNRETSSLRFSIPQKIVSPPSVSLEGILSHPGLETGWRLRWEMDSIFYGIPKDDLSMIEPTVQIAKTGDGMGMEMLWIFLGIIVIAFAVWIFGKGEIPGRPKLPRNIFRLFAFLFFSLGIWLGFPFQKEEGLAQMEWRVWTPELEKSLIEEGKAVYVDYTAKWCATCLGNKRVYSYDSLIDLFNEREIVTLRADWTERGSVILTSLQSFGREGVPLNVYHPPKNSDGVSKNPVILPELLTEDIVFDAIEKEEARTVSGEKNFFTILGFAVLGGLILNLMPCVFPVIGLKVMSFVKQAGQDPKSIKRHGLIFTLGVMLSFWLLVGVLLFLREIMEEDLGWGFQLQEPIFVFILAVFLLVFAMSLSGVFEIGNSITGYGSHLTSYGGYPSSFFSGVLATIVATPCMAPFLGVAVGAALTMDWIQAYMVFSCVAVGLSAPYLILSINPNWISRLPKPGVWMDTFKQAMAFPLYATVAWLLWTLESLL
tara:strand:+ start:467 stop:2614 length:2148 start_codon:yes stop_codon:yes gene_type:complete